MHFVHAELETPWGHVHPGHHASDIQGVQRVVLVLGFVQCFLTLLERIVFPGVVDMTVEHGIALVPSVPCVEGIMGEYKPDTITDVLLFVVLYLHELVPKVVVIEELVIVVSQYQVLLPLQILQQPNRGSGVIAGDIT